MEPQYDEWKEGKVGRLMYGVVESGISFPSVSPPSAASLLEFADQAQVMSPSIFLRAPLRGLRAKRSSCQSRLLAVDVTNGRRVPSPVPVCPSRLDCLIADINEIASSVFPRATPPFAAARSSLARMRSSPHPPHLCSHRSHIPSVAPEPVDSLNPFGRSDPKALRKISVLRKKSTSFGRSADFLRTSTASRSSTHRPRPRDFPSPSRYRRDK